MNNKYTQLEKYAGFLLEKHLQEITDFFMSKIEEDNPGIDSFVKSLDFQEKKMYWKNNFRELLIHLSQGTGHDYIHNLIDDRRNNKLSLLYNDPSALRNLLRSFKIRKFSFFKFLRYYTVDLEIREEVSIELVDFYNYFIEKIMQIYAEIQQDKLITEKEFSQSIINNCVSGISAYDRNGHVTEWNPAMERTYHIRKADILGKRLDEFFPGYDESYDAVAFKKVLGGESVFIKDRKYRLRKGWYEAHMVPLLDNKKEVVGVLTLSHDITVRKEHELKIQEDQHFIKSLTDTSPDVITVYDLELGKNIFSSKEIYEILGYSADQLEELVKKGVQGLIEVIHPEDLPVILNFLESYKSYTGNKVRDLEYRIKGVDGKYRWIMDRYNVFKRSEDGLPIQIIGVARDDTARKNSENEIKKANILLHETNEELLRTEELLKEANNDLERRVEERTEELSKNNSQLLRMNADLDNFIYTASHDLKSPAVNLEGLLTLLKRRIENKIDQDDLKVIDMIHQSIDKLNRTIIDLSEITKAQKDIEGKFEEISIKNILEDVKNDIQSNIQDSKATFKETLQIDKFYFNKSNLRSILYNLLTNAIKYRSEDRSLIIKIWSFEENGRLILCVSDNGLGINENQLPKMFTMFKRFHSHVEGTGIGLYIIKRIIENKGGQIFVESKVDEGTQFRISLPLNPVPKTEDLKDPVSF